MPGRQQKPVALKILRMSSGKAAKLLRGVSPTPGPLVDPPDWFTPDQKIAWIYSIENAPRDVLKRIDKAVLAAFIVAEDIHRRACIESAKVELLIHSPKQGIVMQNLYLPIINRQFTLMVRAAGELGFSPCSRARIDSGKPPAAKAADDWEDVS
jgi:phage terminase small subunit